MEKLLRTTRSICHICYAEIPAAIYRQGDEIIFRKNCLTHGDLSFVLSKNTDYFEQLLEAYFSIIPAGMPCSILEVMITPKCKMDCPICCLKDLVDTEAREFSLADIEGIIKKHPGKEIILFSMEPTEHPELEEIIRICRRYGRSPLLFTNGMKLVDIDYLKKLKASGLSHVYLQFDGFQDSIYETLRGEKLLSDKLQVLDNLKRLDISVTLNVTVAKGVNENQINRIIDYSIENSDFIRQIGFLPLTRVGSADNYRPEIIPELHESLELLQRETKGKIKLDALRAFQKLMYVVYRFAKFRRCFWFTFFILIKKKEGKGYHTIDEFIDLFKIEEVINKYIKHKEGIGAEIKMFWGIARYLVNFRVIGLGLSFLRFYFFGKRLHDARADSRFVFITCTDFCDFYKMDLDMADGYCEELLAFNDGRNGVVCKPTYRKIIEDVRERFNCNKKKV
ncbi:MAG: radical SAM protein [PVC group bacterium]|nr:radical SAM protein [PVC group bacterium]